MRRFKARAAALDLEGGLSDAGNSGASRGRPFGVELADVVGLYQQTDQGTQTLPNKTFIVATGSRAFSTRLQAGRARQTMIEAPTAA